MDGRRQVSNRRGRRIAVPHLGKFCGGAVVWPRSARRQECVLQLSCSLRTSGPARSQAFRTLASSSTPVIFSFAFIRAHSRPNSFFPLLIRQTIWAANERE